MADGRTKEARAAKTAAEGPAFQFPTVPDPHIELLLTIKIGPHAGATTVTCTCGWDRDYKTRQGAIRELNKHRQLNGLPPTKHWNLKTPKAAAA
jgi:hypothetical protein